MDFRFKGVSLRNRSGKYVAPIWVNRKQHYLSEWEAQEDAAVAYDEALIFLASLFDCSLLSRHAAGQSPFASRKSSACPVAVTLWFLQHT